MGDGFSWVIAAAHGLTLKIYCAVGRGAGDVWQKEKDP